MSEKILNTSEDTSFNEKASKLNEGEIIIAKPNNNSFSSTEEILLKYLPGVALYPKELKTGETLKKSKRKAVAVKIIARNKIKEDEIVGMIDTTLTGTGTTGFIFTKSAVFISDSFTSPLVINYADMDEISIKKKTSDSYEINVAVNNGLTWEEDQSINTIKLAELFAELSDFAKKNPDAVKSEIQTSTQEEKTSTQKSNIITTLFMSAIFAWNSFVIVHNITGNPGFLGWAFAIGALIVNIGIILGCSTIVSSVVKKDSFKIGMAYFVCLFLIFGIVMGRQNIETLLEDQSVSLVDEILQEHWGSYAAKCENVEITRDLGNGSYEAVAFLDNNKKMDIKITYYKKTDQIYVEIQ